MLQRAAVLIGVKKTGGLPTLQAVEQGLETITNWLEKQPGMRDAEGNLRVALLSDAAGAPVTAEGVQNAIQRFVDEGTIEQLFVYFAGHGANKSYNEYWLLSGAPRNANEAINVAGSVPLAAQCGIPHVVMISDACRTAAASIQAQTVQGSIIFPNDAPSGMPGFVDVFYATLVGKPSLEVGDAADAAARFLAVYTTSLVAGLEGKAELTAEQDGGKTVQRVKAWPLQEYLAEAVPALLVQRGVSLGVSQTPAAEIRSNPRKAWLSGVPAGAARVMRGGGPVSKGQTESLANVSQQALRTALGAGPRRGVQRPVRARGAASGPRGKHDEMFSEMMERTGVEPGPAHFESRCGFKVSGAGVTEVVSTGGRVEVLDGPNGLVRIWDVPEPAMSVLVVFDDGRGALLPAIQNMIATLKYESGELANVSFEPSDNSPLWPVLQHELPEIRELRRVVATSSRLGVFRPDEGADMNALVHRMRRIKWLDPSMAMYAAYALHAVQQRPTIAEMQGDLRLSLRLSLFDIAMLARSPGCKPEAMPSDVFPAVPLLAQGWALIDAFGVKLPESLNPASIQPHIVDSLWTLFDPEGVALVRAAITSKEIH
jgi:hypothetical protein